MCGVRVCAGEVVPGLGRLERVMAPPDGIPSSAVRLADGRCVVLVVVGSAVFGDA